MLRFTLCVSSGLALALTISAIQSQGSSSLGYYVSPYLPGPASHYHGPGPYLGHHIQPPSPPENPFDGGYSPWGYPHHTTTIIKEVPKEAPPPPGPSASAKCDCKAEVKAMEDKMMTMDMVK